jgi:hypothetical protein
LFFPDQTRDSIDLLQSIRKSDLVGSEVRFDENGDGLGRYNVYNLQRADRRHSSKGESDVVLYRRIGQWSEEGLSLDESLIQWRAAGLPDGARPTSRCSEPCAAGQVKITQSSLEHCCWICQACRSHQIVSNESTCLDCERGWWPIENKTTCFELPLTYIQWTSYLAVLPIGLAITGIALTLFVVGTFMKHKDTPIVKASGQ